MSIAPLAPEKNLTIEHRKAFCSYTALYPIPTTLPPLPSSIPRKSNKLLHPHLNTYSTKSRKSSHKYHRKQLHKNHLIPPRNPRQTQPTPRSSKESARKKKIQPAHPKPPNNPTTTQHREQNRKIKARTGKNGKRHLPHPPHLRSNHRSKRNLLRLVDQNV